MGREGPRDGGVEKREEGRQGWVEGGRGQDGRGECREAALSRDVSRSRVCRGGVGRKHGKSDHFVIRK